jgi:hypothetical protein
MQLQDYVTQVQFLVHDQSNADFSNTELINAVNIARNAVALDFHCVRQLYIAPPQTAPSSALYTPVSVIQNVEAYPLLGPNGHNGQVVGARVTAGGSNYSASTVVSFAAGPSGSIQATGTPVITSGVITGINMTAWGQGYNPNGNLNNTASVTSTNAGAAGVVQLEVGDGTVSSVAGFSSGDQVTVSGVTGTTEANGTWIIDVIIAGSNGRINLRNTTFVHAWVSGGTVVDNTTVSVQITDSGGGSGATASAVMFNNVFNVISISYIWGNQRYMLRFRGFTLFQAYMRSLLTFNQRALIWTIHEQSGIVLIQPPPDQPYVSEWDVLALPMPLVNLTDADTQVINPWADAVQYYAAWYCMNKLQNFQQAEEYLKIYSARVPKIIIGAGGVRIPNPYHRTFQRRVAR